MTAQDETYFVTLDDHGIELEKLLNEFSAAAQAVPLGKLFSLRLQGLALVEEPDRGLSHIDFGIGSDLGATYLAAINLHEALEALDFHYPGFDEFLAMLEEIIRALGTEIAEVTR